MARDFNGPYEKWRAWALKQIEREEGKIDFGDFRVYEKPFKAYWSDELSVGVLERDKHFIGVACLAAKEVTDKEGFVRRFGLSFEKDLQWKAVSSLLEHLSRSPVFKAVLITTSQIPFRLEPDVPEELEGRLSWAKRNYEFHRNKAEKLKAQIQW